MSNTAPLVTEYLAAKAAADAAADVLAKARDAILATGMAILRGDTVNIEVVLSERNALDTAAVKKLLGDKAPMKASVVTTLKIKPA